MPIQTLELTSKLITKPCVRPSGTRCIRLSSEILTGWFWQLSLYLMHGDAVREYLRSGDLPQVRRGRGGGRGSGCRPGRGRLGRRGWARRRREGWQTWIMKLQSFWHVSLLAIYYWMSISLCVAFSRLLNNIHLRTKQVHCRHHRHLLSLKIVIDGEKLLTKLFIVYCFKPVDIIQSQLWP